MKERKSQLVCEHLENISRKALEEYQSIIRKYVRNRHGIYALYLRGKLQYVGLAGSLQGRLKTHLHDRHKDSWDRFTLGSWSVLFTPRLRRAICLARPAWTRDPCGRNRGRRWRSHGR